MDARQDGCKTGRIQDRMDSKQNGCKTGGVQDRIVSKQDGYLQYKAVLMLDG